MDFFKRLKNTFILTSLVYIVIGVIMLVKPDDVANVICYIIGGAMILYGIVKGLGFFTSPSGSISARFELVFGVIFVIAGFFVILNSDFVMSVIPIVMGVVLIVDSLDRVRKAAEMKSLGYEKWWIFLLIGILLAILGIVLIAVPFKVAKTFIRIIGIFLIYDGISDLVTAGSYSYIFKQAKKSSDAIETTAEEK